MKFFLRMARAMLVKTFSVASYAANRITDTYFIDDVFRGKRESSNVIIVRPW